MGCDIHLTAERRVDGVWVNDDLYLNTEYPTEHYIENKGTYDERIYSGRNYDLFAILADVRNGYGFAGVDTGEGFKPIAAPKGVPDNASAIYKEWVAEMGADGHSHSYFTVAELMAYDWTQVTIKHGVVGYQELARWKLNGAPEHWSGGISGRGIVHHESATAIALIEPIIGGAWRDLLWAFEGESASERPSSTERNRLDPVTYAQLSTALGERPVFNIAWKRPYYRVAREFLGETLPRLWRMGAPDGVRILFFFDN